MTEFFTTALSFPTVLFSFALLVVIGFWVLALTGSVGLDIFDGAGGMSGWFESWGMGGVPVTVAATGVVTTSWFGCLAGGVAIENAGLTGPVAIAAGAGVLVLAVAVAVIVTKLLTRRMRRALEIDAPPSHHDFVGKVCVIRTGHVDDEFGQAEIVSADGSSAIIQVRTSGRDAAATPLAQGDEALIFDYEHTTSTFLVAPWEGI